MFRVEMYTWTGFSGVLYETLDNAMKYIMENPSWYYVKITDSMGDMMYEGRRPYFVRFARRLKDNYTHEYFWTGECFQTPEEAGQAVKNCPIPQNIEVLKDRFDYMDKGVF